MRFWFKKKPSEGEKKPEQKQQKEEQGPRMFLDGWIVFAVLVALAIYFLFWKSAYGLGIMSGVLAVILLIKGWKEISHPNRAAVFTLGIVTGVADSGPALRIPLLQKFREFSVGHITYAGDRIPKQTMSTKGMTTIEGRMFATVRPGDSVKEVRTMFHLPLTPNGDVDPAQRDEIFLDILWEKVRAVVGEHTPEELVSDHKKIIDNMTGVADAELREKFGHRCEELGIADYDEHVKSEKARRIAMAEAKEKEAELLGKQVSRNPELTQILIAGTYASAASSIGESIARVFAGKSAKQENRRTEQKQEQQEEGILGGIIGGLKNATQRRKGGKS